MAVTETYPNNPAPAQPEMAEAQTLPPDRFDRMFGRMKGTLTIVGDIVDPDPELWNCERE